MAKFVRSKEKRTDAQLIVLAMVVNAEGFLKYSDIFQIIWVKKMPNFY